MERDDLVGVIAKNITELRRSHGMTQAVLAEKLGYSDKSVSKWERSEGIPDIICLKKISDLFGVTVDYLLHEKHDSSEIEAHESVTSVVKNEDYIVNHRAIVLLAITGVWLLAVAVYVIVKLCNVEFTLPFAAALPLTALLLVIFNSLWGKRKWNCLTVSALVWSILFLICFICRKYNMWLLMTIGIPATVVVWLSCRVKVKSVHSKNSTDE